jgi:ubiquinone/menaquinone biosynthesis C-methylase UbiE
MAAKHKDKRSLTWAVMDVCSLQFQDASYDAVVDKGTLDSVLCGDNSTANAAKYCSEVSRVMRAGATFFIVSYGTPENRLSYLEKEEFKWRVTVHTIRTSSLA